MAPRREQWEGCVFRRGRKLWLKVKGPGGWKQVPTPFHSRPTTLVQVLVQ